MATREVLTRGFNFPNGTIWIPTRGYGAFGLLYPDAQLTLQVPFDDRQLLVGRDNRIFLVERDDRQFGVGRDDRMYQVPDDDRDQTLRG